jgi:DNA repair protein RecO (recombination protein O)
MSTEKSQALILRLVDFSETSAVVTMFTRDFGKISALAKGARRLKGPFESALDLLAICRVVFIHKSTDALDLLTEAKLERRFRAAARDLSRLYAGYYVAELLTALTDDSDPHPDLFDASIRVLANLDGNQPVAETVLAFEMAALRLLGHMPSWEQCAGCGRPLPNTARVAFGQLAGGVLCAACRPGQRQVASLQRETIDILRQYATAPVTKLEPLPPRRRGEIRGVMNHYLANLLGRRPRMHQYLGILS